MSTIRSNAEAGAEAATTSADKNLSNLTDTGKIKSAHLSMPSGTYDTLTLGASYAEYIAPSDGYVYFAKRPSAAGDAIELMNKDKNYGIRILNHSSSAVLRCMIPVAKGDKFTAVYDGSNTTDQEFTFFYAIGSESEKVVI